MNNIGLLTFHAAYNVGSVLQAYATQQAIEALGGSCEIINYRTKYQRRFYESLVRTRDGKGNFLRDVTRLPNWRASFERKRRYESFISRMKISEELSTPRDVYAMWSRYASVVSGSDQIWNRKALELRRAPHEYMDPYLLAGYQGKRVSYASSIGSMDKDDLQLIGSKVAEFDCVSAREQRAVELLSQYAKGDVTRVLDPTLLLDRDQWASRFSLVENAPKGRYLVCYTLRDVRVLHRYLPLIKSVLDRRDLEFALVVSPFANSCIYELRTRKIRGCPEYGPTDILSAFFGANAIITDSFHGTAFAINFEKDFLSIDLGSSTDYRKMELLELMGLESHLAPLEDAGVYRDIPKREESGVSSRITKLRETSLAYLRDALEL